MLLQSLIDSINIKNMTQDEIQRQFNVLIQENCQMKGMFCNLNYIILTAWY